MGTRMSLVKGKFVVPMTDRAAILVALFLVLGAIGCAPEEDAGTVVKVVEEVPAIRVPEFNADSAYAFVAEQVAFGPRVPGTAAHKACGDMLVARLKAYGAQVTEQTGTVTAFSGQKLPVRNIIAAWRPEEKERVLLFAHWDTRPFADRDTENKNTPIDGANDGASGVGVWLEVARHLNVQQPALGVDIIFFDVEDFGQPNGAMSGEGSGADSWCLGSQYWAKNLHVPGYTARYGILLDMVGAKDAIFPKEAISMNFAPHVVRKVWRTAASLGYADRFVDDTKYFVGTDDHDIVNRRVRIPSIDIIEYNPGTQGFHPSWHTHDDSMEVIDRNTLEVVGRTVTAVVWQER